MKRVYFLLMVIILTSIVFLSCSNDDEENHAPSCSITSPPNNSIYAIGDSIKILVDANDSDGYIVDILFYMNDDPVGSDNVFPYKYAFSTTDLVAGNYSITAIAKDNDGAETEKILNFGVAPNAPINLQINQISITSAEIKWKNYSSGEEKFEIERKLSSETTEFFAKLGEVIRTDSINYSWVDMTLLPNLTYDYRVRGVNGTNYSEYITESYLNYFPEPSLLTYQNDAIDRIKLTWVDNSIGEDGFKIDKKNGEEEWINGYAILVENVETWTDVNAEINQFLKYRIYAYKDSVTSSLFETPEPIDNTFPAPTDLIITQTSVTSAELSWKDNSIGEDKFEIERKLSTETTFVKIAEVIGDDTETKNWSESSLTINLTYDYRVKAVKNIHSSTYFEKRGYETFAAPSKLTPAV
ncbi:MAG: hypothetical protein KKD38_09805, partial [Candidatus Delongbacteria bacterium]|nr:hypothetical protein [Candidatus Delongbacteria bacterium]